MSDGWRPPGATKDRQTLTARWEPARLELIDGVRVREVANIPKRDGHLTEIFRSDWALDATGVGQVFQVVLASGKISGWHAHEKTLDRLFVSSGIVRIVLFDGRDGSPTKGRINEFRFGTIRPALVVVPPRVWHGLQNVGEAPAVVLNLVDLAYDYEDPDHWRLPSETTEIPFRW